MSSASSSLPRPPANTPCLLGPQQQQPAAKRAKVTRAPETGKCPLPPLRGETGHLKKFPPNGAPCQVLYARPTWGSYDKTPGPFTSCYVYASVTRSSGSGISGVVTPWNASLEAVGVRNCPKELRAYNFDDEFLQACSPLSQPLLNLAAGDDKVSRENCLKTSNKSCVALAAEYEALAAAAAPLSISAGSTAFFVQPLG